jgi:ADP-heptose:LPS heptosyltransferase
MNKTFVINGGAGRVIAAIPALEKFARLEPDNDFRIIVHGWQDLYWSHPLLQPRTVGIHQKNIFHEYVQNYDLVCPEPYYIHDYYRQNISLIEAFDRQINNTVDHTDLTKPNLYISTYEKLSAKRIIEEFKQIHKKNKVVVFQPYGSTMTVNNGIPYDNSNRSLNVDDYLKIGKFLNDKDCLILFFGNRELKHPNDNFSADLTKFNPDLRMYMTLISECDYFIGCDSVGQHIAYSFNKPGTVFMGGTFEKNITYPKHFKIIRKKDQRPVYSPIRLSGVDSDFTDRLNDGIMNFSNLDIEHFCQIILKDVYDE